MPSTMPFFSINSAQHSSTFGMWRSVLERCSPKSQPKTLSFKIPDCFSLRRDGLFRMKLLKNAISLPCFLNTGFMGLIAKLLKAKQIL